MFVKAAPGADDEANKNVILNQHYSFTLPMPLYRREILSVDSVALFKRTIPFVIKSNWKNDETFAYT